MERVLKLGLIGAGQRGRIASLAHRPEGGSRLVAVCDLDDAILAAWAGEYGPGLFATRNYRELLAQDLDAVFVCTPDWLHEEHAIAAMEAGKAVYLEKPMALSAESGRRIMQRRSELNGIVYVGHNMRFMPVMQKMHELVVAGRIGEVQAIWCRHFVSYGGDAYFRDWHSERAYGNGLLLQKGIHDIDMIHWFAGAYARRVTAMGKLSVYNRCPRRTAGDQPPTATFNREHWPPLSQKGFSERIDVEDHNMVLLELENGVQASYLQCHYTPDDHRNYTIIGTEGRLENCGDSSSDSHWAAIRIWDRRCGYLEAGTESFAVPPIGGGHGGSDPLIVEDFLSVLRGERRRGASLEDACMSVAAAAAATESLRSGGRPLEVAGWEVIRPARTAP